MKQEKVSVVLCTYQGERFLAEQLQSILAQTRRPDEIIVSDDASADNTVAVAEKLLRGSGIAYEIHVNEQNIGFRQNFAQAMQRASDDILFLSDQDDVWHQEKIARMLVPFERSETLMAFHDAALVDSALRPLAPSFWRTMTFDPEPFQKKDYRRLLVSNVVQGSASAFRRSLLADALPIPDIAIHDEWLALFAALRGGLVPVSDALMKYRQSDENALGAGAVTFLDRLERWTHLQEKIKASHRELRRRRLMLEAWKGRAQDIYPRSAFLVVVMAYARWLAMREEEISRGIMPVARHARQYHVQIENPMIAFKTWMKDLLLAGFGRVAFPTMKGVL